MWNSRDFEKQRDTVTKHFERVGYSQSNVGDFCTMVGIPLVVVYDFLSVQYPDSALECRSKIEEIEKFYGILKEKI